MTVSSTSARSSYVGCAYGKSGSPLMVFFLAGIIEGAKDGRGRGRQVIAGQSKPSLTVILKVTYRLSESG